jgi:hypothetical protein
MPVQREHRASKIEMKTQSGLIAKWFLTAAVVFVVMALTGSRYFDWIANKSEFEWLCLASTVIIHLRVRPKWTEVLLLLLTTGLVCGFVYGLMRYSPHIMSALAFLGVSSLAVMAIRCIWSVGEEQRLFLWAFFPALLFVAAGWLTPPLLSYTEAAHAKVLDLYLYSFDCSLRIQPSFWLGALFVKWNWLKVISYFLYLGLAVPIAAVFADRLVRMRDTAVPVFLALLFCGPIGGIFYNLFPALGPAHLFGHDFPFHPITAIQAKHLLLEPVAIPGFRNAIPSLHMAWVLLAFWYCRGASIWTKSVVAVFMFFTVLATLGSGEHYLIDLVVAVPFCVMLEGLFEPAIRWNSPWRVATSFGGLLAILAWFSALRFANPFFWISPAIPWILCIATVAGGILAHSGLRQAVDRELSRESRSTGVGDLSSTGLTVTTLPQ